MHLCEVDLLREVDSHGGGVVKKFSKEGIPLTLQPGKKIPLKLAERTQLSRTVVSLSSFSPEASCFHGFRRQLHVGGSTLIQLRMDNLKFWAG